MQSVRKNIHKLDAIGVRCTLMIKAIRKNSTRVNSVQAYGARVKGGFGVFAVKVPCAEIPA